MFDVLVFGRWHLQVIALLVEILQYHVDVLAGQLALRAEYQIEGMVRFAESQQQVFRNALQCIAFQHVEVHLVFAQASVDGSNTFQGCSPALARLSSNAWPINSRRQPRNESGNW